MSTSIATSLCGKEQMLSELNPQHQQEKIPLRCVHIQSNSRSSSGTSEVISITKIAYEAAATCGSPPTCIGDVSYSMLSSSSDDSTTTSRIADSRTSNFRLEPKFGPNTKLRSNPPFCSNGGSSAAIRGRKRTAQSMALHDSMSNAVSKSAIAGRPPLRIHPDNQLSPCNVRHSYAMAPVSPRFVHSTAFNMQGLSLRSPVSTNSAVVRNTASDFQRRTNNAFVASPSAERSSFNACGSSSFSKVNRLFATTATVDGTSPFRKYRSGLFRSALEQPDFVGVTKKSIDIPSPSPRIVPLTVLTHNSVPTLKFGSSVAGGQPPTTFALGVSPLLLSVGSSSTNDDYRSCAVKNSDIVDATFRGVTRTVQRSRPTPSVMSNISVEKMIIDVDANRKQTPCRRGNEVDIEPLSDDDDDDEFFLTVPSSLVEENHIDAEPSIYRQSKQPRLLHTAQVFTGNNHIVSLNHSSVTSFGSQSTLFGTGYAMSNVRGNDSLSNMSSHLPVHGQHQASLFYSACTKVNGSTMKCVGSTASIGLELDPNGRVNAPTFLLET